MGAGVPWRRSLVVGGAGVPALVLLAWTEFGAKAAEPPRATSIQTIRALGGQVDWSPSENLIVYDAPGRGGYYELRIMAPDGSGDRCLTCDVPQLPGRNT